MLQTRRVFLAVTIATLTLSISGCTSFSEYVHNGFKVGPNYCRPPAPVAQHWIDQADIRRDFDPASLCRWWTILNDPKLDELIACAYRQNLSLKEAGFRILQARANLAYAKGNLFPQQQIASGEYSRSGSNADGFSDRWTDGFSLSWELDFWGQFRRAVTAADDRLAASVADYDGALVTMLADISQNYVQIRTDQERIVLLQANADLQRKIVKFISDRFKAGKLTPLDLNQAVSNLRQTEAAIPQLEISVRQAENRLCTLLGMPTVALWNMLGPGPIPTCPPEVALGMPAQLLGQRPDVRRAERLAAAQAEQIGIQTANLYPAFKINGNLGYSAQNFPDLFSDNAFKGGVGPSFQWNLLNYGRIVANIRYEDARFQELAVSYQLAVLRANEEVENGLVTFLRAQRRSKLLNESVAAARAALAIVTAQYEQGAVDFNRYAVIQQNLVTQQDSAASALGQIAQGLIQTYRALGGGWQVRLAGGIPLGPNGVEQIPAPPPAAPIAPNPPPVAIPQPPNIVP